MSQVPSATNYISNRSFYYENLSQLYVEYIQDEFVGLYIYIYPSAWKKLMLLNNTRGLSFSLRMCVRFYFLRLSKSVD